VNNKNIFYEENGVNSIFHFEQQIKKAEEELAKAEKEISKNKPDKAIMRLAKAWLHA